MRLLQKTTLRTAEGAKNVTTNDIFQSAVRHIYSNLQPLGYKLLKNNDIKKKTGKFTARIFFFRNSRNYLVSGSNRGSVKTEIHCIISTKDCEGAYRLRFGESGTSWFELYDNKGGINTQVVEDACKIIIKEFVKVVEGLEKDAHAQLQKMNLVPHFHSDDFSYICYIKRRLLELFGFPDILKEYDANSELFNRPDMQAKRAQDHYFATLRERINYAYAESLSNHSLLALLDEAYIFLKTKDKYSADKLNADFQLCHTILKEDKVRFVVAVFKFLYPTTYVWFKDEPAISELNRKTLELYERLIKK